MLLPWIAGAASLFISYLFTRLRYKRFSQYAYFPQMAPSLVLGHLKVMGDFVKVGKENGHPDLAFKAVNEALGQPPLMLMDLRPFGPAMVVIRSHELAEQVAKAYRHLPYSLPKMPEVYGHMVHVTGPTTILNAQGEQWKQLRRRFNNGFAHQHLMTFLPTILEKSINFTDHLDQIAASKRSFSMVGLTGNLVFDIIASVTMNVDFGAQNEVAGGKAPNNDFVTTYRELFETYAGEQMDLPWFFTPFTEWKRSRLAKKLRATLRGVVREAYAKSADQKTKPRSILSLSLEELLHSEQISEMLPPRVIDEACDQLSTFLFAGHDTTSILLSYMFYEISRTPHAAAAIRKEMDDIFGPDSTLSDVRKKLLSNENQECLNKMTYTTAVVKETLRLWPPAGSARLTIPGAGITVSAPNGETYNLEGVSIYNCHIMIQRDPAVYGDSANDWVPERWLDKSQSDKIPASAWRPFERGPRNCIGQGLVEIEARVIMALVIRRYDFIKVGLGAPMMDEAGNVSSNKYGQYKVASEMYPV
ncbi:cytochrome P450 [Xylariaceae sp. FL1019]|nr:cytochrome P450 [Xylariaceae sp. FL1019]